jgi:GT2 family glycosyltransferase
VVEPSISVVIPSWNRRDLLSRCLESLRHQECTDFETIVVDNGSTDGSVELVRRHFPDVILLCQSTNLGFAGAVNEGIRASRGRYVALLNNDAVPDPGWLLALRKRIERSDRIGAVSAKVVRREPSGVVTFDSTGDFLHVWGLPTPRGRGLVDKGEYDEPEEVFAACGAAAMYRKSMFDEIGLFDPQFFAYYEDVDVSFRAQLAGYRVWYEPGAVVHHEISATSGGGRTKLARYHGPKNQWFLYLKNMPGALFWRHLAGFWLMQVLFFGRSMTRGLGLAHARSVGRGLLDTPRMLAKRKRIQRRRVLSEEQVESLLLKGVPRVVHDVLRGSRPEAMT